MSDKRGACREQAENRLYRLDPKPDLDNANVGIYHTQHIFLCCLFTDMCAGRRLFSCRAAAGILKFLILDCYVYILYLIYGAFMVKY